MIQASQGHFQEDVCKTEAHPPSSKPKMIQGQQRHNKPKPKIETT